MKIYYFIKKDGGKIVEFYKSNDKVAKSGFTKIDTSSNKEFKEFLKNKKLNPSNKRLKYKAIRLKQNIQTGNELGFDMTKDQTNLDQILQELNNGYY